MSSLQALSPAISRVGNLIQQSVNLDNTLLQTTNTLSQAVPKQEDAAVKSAFGPFTSSTTA
jgi:hypothetical protein